MNLLDIIKKKKTEDTTKGVVATKTDEGKNETKPFAEGLVSVKDVIAPGSIEIDFDYIRIDNRYHRSMFVAGYPRFVGINWLSPLINFDASMNIAFYIYPTDGKEILDDLRRKIAEMEAEISTDIQRGRVVNPATQAKLEDALTLQSDLVKGEERFFQFGLYVTASANTKEELNRITKNIESALGALMIITKKATLQMEEGLVSTLPMCNDRLKITRNMDTTSLATTFPFVSSDLSDDKGIMYGINEHNGSLVIFDRFSMPNYNSVVFATAGAGKSYLIKLEAMRSLMFDTDIIVIDPENEYKSLCESVGGQYIAFGYDEASKINPFDLSLVEEEGENALNSKILNLHKLFKTMIGAMDPIEESILDRAVMDAYKMKGITPDPDTQKREPPLLEDLYKSLIGMEEQKAQVLAARFEKFIRGSFGGILNQKTTVNLNNRFVVFGIRNLEEALRPVAMHIILDYIWTVVKKELKRRILVVDEAWYLMQYEDSASFLRGVVKRGRKYYLGVTTITQDVDDFLQTPYGKEIVTNSSIQILLKQHSAAIDLIGEVFYLSEGERQLLLSADKGEGIFFAGQNHVAIRVIASEDEHRLITSNPEEVLKLKQQGKVPTLEVAPGIVSLKAKMEEINSKIGTIRESNEVKTVTTNLGEETKETEVEERKPEETMAITPKETLGGLGEVKIKKEETTETQILPEPTLTSQAPIIKTTVEEEIKPEPQIVESQPIQNEQPEVLIAPTEAPKVIIEEKTQIDPIEELLQRRIKEMEEKEQSDLKEHQKKIEAEAKLKAEEEEKKKKLEGSFSGFGSLPKYQDLFKSSNGGNGTKLPPLPPLPPLPKFEEPVKKQETSENMVKKPVFMKPEPVIPQPPQLKKKTVAALPNDWGNKLNQNQQIKPFEEDVKEENVEDVVKEPKIQPFKTEVVNPTEDSQNNKPDSYDELFGNGIV